MFTRWGEAKTGRDLPEPLLAEAARIHAMPIASSGIIASPPPGPELRVVETLGSGPPPPPPQLGQVVPASVRIGDEAAAAGLHHSVIGADLAIEGQSITIRCKGALEINGSIQAELHSKSLVVGQSGRVEGAVWADTIDVRGKVCGTIKGSRVILHPSAEVEGDIHASSLSVSDGATFEGRSRRATDPASVAPQLDASKPVVSAVSEPPPLPTASPVRPTAIGG
jgi:cytoskeletal protein CcmA (bactofilin family)